MNAVTGSLVVLDMHADEKVMWNGVLLTGASISKCKKSVTITTPTPTDSVFDEIRQAGIKVKVVNVDE